MTWSSAREILYCADASADKGHPVRAGGRHDPRPVALGDRNSPPQPVGEQERCRSGGFVLVDAVATARESPGPDSVGSLVLPCPGVPSGPGRKGLHVPQKPPPPATTRHRAYDPRTPRPAKTPQEPRLPKRPARRLRQRAPQETQHRRTRHQPPQGLPGRRHPLRETRLHPPRHRHTRSPHHLAQNTIREKRLRHHAVRGASGGLRLGWCVRETGVRRARCTTRRGRRTRSRCRWCSGSPPGWGSRGTSRCRCGRAGGTRRQRRSTRSGCSWS